MSVKAGKFVHLHVHSEYSLLDGALKIKDMVKQVKAMGMSSIALTDHGNMCGAIDFYREARRQGVRAILGFEAYMSEGRRTDRNSRIGEGVWHLTLLAKDNVGYQNLLSLCSLAHEEGFHYRPRIDRELFEKYHQGLIVLSGCLSGELAGSLLKGAEAAADKAAAWYRDLLGPDRFFIEVQDHGMPEQRQLNPMLAALAKRLGLSLVATNDVHYLRKADFFAHEVLLCIQTGKTIEDPDRMRMPTDQFYLKSPAEMAEAFSEMPEAVEMSWEIAERCGVELTFADEKGGKWIFPPFPIPSGLASAQDYLRSLCDEGIRKRYGNPAPEVLERLEHELKVISETGFATYFLIVGDIVKYAKDRGIFVGPGRGSSAGSLVAYLLGITDLDPIRYELIFERFLNPHRKEPPDIDIDFPDNRRDEVMDYIREKYGQDNVAKIGTFARMNARQVVKDVGRVMGLSFSDLDRVSKMIPGGPNSTLAKGLEIAELKNAIEEKKELKQVFEVAQSLEGLARHVSKHAAGVVIATGGVRNYTPLLRLDDNFVTQFDMDGVKSLGLLKMDLLGLKTLTVLDEARQAVRKTRGVEVNYQQIPLDDPETFKLFAAGHTDGIFQFESAGMRDAMSKLKPEVLEDLIALNALYRPGPMDQIDRYIKRARGLEPVAYDVPELESILKKTYGVVVYQEQVIQIPHKLAGYSMAEADDFRRSVGKKITELMEAQEATFLTGAAAHGIPRDKAEIIFDFLERFAGYGFNRSHSAAYALLAYWTAYMKVHYSVEFMAALLTSEMRSQEKICEYVVECRKMGIPVLLPDINKSETVFSVELKPGTDGKPDSIRFGMAAVKNVGEAATSVITAERNRGGPYRSLFNFCERVDNLAVNRKVLESLIKCGAFESLGAKREQLLAVLGNALERGARRQQERSQGQESLFRGEKDVGDEQLPEVDQTPERTRLSYEKELLGCYVSGHPLAEFEEEMKRFGVQSLKPGNLAGLPGGSTFRVAGVTSRVKQGQTKTKNPFMRLQLEDLEGGIEVLVWQEALKKVTRPIVNADLLLVTGSLQKQDEGRMTLIARELLPLEEASVRLTRALHIRLNAVGSDENLLKSLHQIVSFSPGQASVCLHIKTLHHGEAVLEAHPSLKVKPTQELVGQLKALLGENSVSLSEKV